MHETAPRCRAPARHGRRDARLGLWRIYGAGHAGPAGAWALETVDGRALPHAYADTNSPVVSSGIVLADTLVLLEAEQGERLTWLDEGGGPYRLRTPLLWTQPGGPSGDSVTVTELFRVGGVHHRGSVLGDRLTLRIEFAARPGTYGYTRAPR